MLALSAGETWTFLGVWQLRCVGSFKVDVEVRCGIRGAVEVRESAVFCDGIRVQLFVGACN